MLEDYILIQTINDEHKVYLVKNIQDSAFYVKKHLSYFENDVYQYLYTHKLKGVPFIKELIHKDKELIVIEEYISGETLESILEREKRLPFNKTVDILNQLCDILNQLSVDKPFVHRDIKPSNIILKNNTEVYLIDFDASKFSNDKSRDTVLLGTAGYASPEQYGFGSSSIQSDIYAIGVMLKEMLTGTTNLNDSYNGKLWNVIAKCTKMDPNDRYRSYSELKNELNGKFRKTLKDFALVGFRNDNHILKILAAFWYLFIIALGSWMTVDETNGPISNNMLLVDKIGFSLTLFFVTLFSGNYLGIQQFFYIKKEWNIYIKIFLVLFADAFIIFVSVFLIMFVESFF